MGTVRDLHDFLEEAELLHYYSAICNQLRISTVPQLKYVEEEDLAGIGMSKPEMRRLKKLYKKECPHGALGKIKKAILTRSDGPGRTLSPSPPEQRSRPTSYIVSPGRQIIPAEAIHINKSLGEGEFGVVQQGVWTTERGEKVQVALKCLSKERMENGTQEFLKEAAIMQTIDHDNICAMFGVVIDKDDTLILVTELAPMRSLLECLKEPTLRLDFPLSRLCDFAQQICDGMSYLESKRLIHRDLAARNILVFSKHKVKISDFGLSRALGVGKDYYQSKYSINLKLPIAWCAPECINYLKFTSASDVWAYGVTLWEMFTYGFQPWAGLNGQEILEAIDTPNSQRLECPDLCPKDYYDLMLKCWYHDPQKRPTFSEISILLPQMRPITMKASREFPEVTVPKDYLYYKANDVVHVIDKNTSNSPAPGLWKGILSSGKSGYFDPANFVPFIETRASPASPASRAQLTRKESKRHSKAKLLSAAMISGPQNDLRHTGHIGYDGAVFGDVSFIGDNYDKLPVKVSSTGKINELHRISPDKDGLSMNGHLGSGHSCSEKDDKISQESIDSTFALKSDENPHKSMEYTDIDDDSIFADFKMPDISSSFDFGPSFMDEVLKALNEKESKLETPEKETTPFQEDTKFSWEETREKKQSPPPLPAQPPRMETKRETPKPEPRKQAKVKPMSSSDEKRMESAIAMANEFAAHSTKSHMIDAQSPPTSPIGDKNIFDSENSESPKLMKKLKNSIKKSPKAEKKRTFSEEFSNKADLEEDVPPAAQEAYNMLVVRGSIKDTSKSEEKSFDREFRLDRGSEWESRVKQESYGLQRSSPARQDSINSYSSSTSGQESWRSPPETVSRQDSWSNRDNPEHQDSWNSKRESPARQDSWNVKRESPARQDSWRSKTERTAVPLANTAEVFLDSQLEEPIRPKPKPRTDRSEIPVPAPKPRAEIVQRVEPVQRPQRPPPSIPKSMDYDLKVDLPEEKVNGVNKRFSTTSDHNSTASSENEDSKNQIDVLRIDLPDSYDVRKGNSSDTSSKDSQQEESSRNEPSRKDSFKNDLLWSEDFSEPSPREIMSKLARESRIRRSLDHQRGALGDGLDSGPSRNIREPQGIPGKGISAANDDEEVDTNPLRMLRGGAIPTVRGGRVGQGTVSNVSSVPPKLRVKLPALHHSLSVDSGTNRVEHVNEGDKTSCGNDNNHNKRSLNKPPAVPPRSYSISHAGSHRNPVPLPPRKPLRKSTLNAPPRERKYPLLPNDDPGHTTSCSSNVARSSTQNTQTKHDCDVDSSTPPPLLPRSKSVCNDQENSEEEDDSVFIVDDDAPQSNFEPHSNLNQIVSNHPPPLGLKKGPNSLDLDKYSPVKLQNGSSSNKAATFPRSKYRLQNVNCNLEQLGFYNRPDPFWDKSLVVAGRNYSDPLGSSEEISPLMLANYKTSDGVSYEDLLDFALDREKNSAEIETMLKVFCNEVSVQDCKAALEDTGRDVLMAIKYLKLKQLLSLDLGDINHCKEALVSCDWDVPRAVDYVFSQGPPSPECVDV